MSDYERIYLQPECCADPDVGRLWCQDDGPETCPDGEKWTPYVLASEYDRLQSEVERLRGRLCKTCEGTGMIGGPSPSAPDEGGESCPECNAWLLRKQAEAAEEVQDLITMADSVHEMQRAAYNYAQRLRQQADEVSDGT